MNSSNAFFAEKRKGGRLVEILPFVHEILVNEQALLTQDHLLKTALNRATTARVAAF
jgi:hypothetical protein